VNRLSQRLSAQAAFDLGDDKIAEVRHLAGDVAADLTL
jgi:hypothetical protein